MTSPFVEIADRCFVARYRQWDVNVGLVVGSDSAMVIDTRASSQQGKEILRDVHALGLDVPVRTVANTHVHFDHSFGNGSFPEARIIAHDAVGRRWPEDEVRIKALFRADPGDGPEYGYTAADVRGILATAVRGPDDTFELATTVDLGDREVRLVHAGRGHTDGDIAIRVPDADVTFLGDLIEESSTPALGGDSYPLEWASTLEQITSELAPTEVVVPGHGQRVDRAFIGRQTLDIATIAAVVRDLWAAGVPESEAAESGTGRWPWPNDALGHAVARGYAHLSEGQNRLSLSPSG